MMGGLRKSVDVGCQSLVSENKFEKKNLKHVSFKNTISICFQDKKPFEAALNSIGLPRKVEGSVFRLFKEGENTVRYHVKNVKVTTPKPTFKDLYDEISCEIEKLSTKMMPQMDCGLRTHAVNFIARELEQLVMTNCKASLHTLKGALRERICNHRIRNEPIDRMEWIQAQSNKECGQLVRNAPESMSLFCESLWERGEEKRITLTYVQDKDVGTFARCVDLVLNQVRIRSILTDFISFSEEEKLELRNDLKDQNNEEKIGFAMKCLVAAVVSVVTGFFLFLWKRKDERAF